MAARSGMVSLVTRLRMFTNTAIADYSDDTLQSYLDQYQSQVYFAPMTPKPALIAGTYIYLDYIFPEIVSNNVEQADTDSGFAVRIGDGTAVDPSTYTVNYDARKVSFAAPTGNILYFLDARSYNIFAAAAQIWEAKAAAVAANFDIKTDNHDLKSSQEYEMYMKMASTYRAKAGPGYGRMVRLDQVPESYATSDTQREWRDRSTTLYEG